MHIYTCTWAKGVPPEGGRVAGVHAGVASRRGWTSNWPPAVRTPAKNARQTDRWKSCQPTA